MSAGCFWVDQIGSESANASDKVQKAVGLAREAHDVKLHVMEVRI